MNVHLTFQPLWGISGLWVGFVGMALLLSFFSSYGVRGKKPQWISFFLRLLTWACVGILVWKGTLVYVQKQVERQRVAVLVDRSQSMSFPVSKNETRWEEIQKWFKGDVWKEEQLYYDVSYFEFGGELFPTSLQSIFSHQPDQEETRLFETVKTLSKEKKWDGFILFTDGVDTTEQTFLNEKLSAPRVAFYPDNQENLTDLALLKVNAPEQAFIKNQIQMEFHLEAVGANGQPLRFRLWNGDRLIADRFLSQDDFKTGETKVLVDWIPDRVGIQVMRGEFLRIPNEASYENNSKSFLIRVLRDRARVLHVVGRPSWDERFLRDYLKENPNIDLISFFILRQPGNQPEASERELSLIPFPYQDLFTTELPNFDLVIFQNFNFNRYFSPFYLENLKSFVENGGAFLMLGGDLTYGKGGYADTGLEQVLPFRIRTDLNEFNFSPFHASWGSQAQGHPILQDFQNGVQWNDLPMLQGFHRTGGLQPDSSVLLEVQNNSKDPILAVRQVGQGRVVAFTIDTLWKWALSENSQGPKVYRQLLNGIYRWLLRDLGSSLIEAKLFEKNENAIQFRILDRQYHPLKGVSLQLQLKNGNLPEKEYKLEPTHELGESVLSLPEMGEVIELTARWPGKEKEGYLLHTAFYGKKKEADELRRRSVDVGTLSKITLENPPIPISRANRNSFDPLQKNARIKWVGEREIPLWDQPLFIILILSLACFEWWFRRKNSGS